MAIAVFGLNLIAWVLYFALVQHGLIVLPALGSIDNGVAWLTLAAVVAALFTVLIWLKIGFHPHKLFIQGMDKRSGHIQSTRKKWGFLTFSRFLHAKFLGIGTLLLTPLLCSTALGVYAVYQGLGAKAMGATFALMVFGNPLTVLGVFSVWIKLTVSADQLQRSEHQDLPVWRGLWWDTLIPLWLLGANADERAQFDQHGAWRVRVYFTQIYRRWQYYEWKRGIAKQRWLWVLAVAAGILFLGPTLLDFFDSHYGLHLKEALKSSNAGAQAANIVIFLLSAGVLYLLWFFRDQNALWQIENARKDVNLKDFQRISEWAAGMHLPEDKRSESIKYVDAANAQDKRTETLNIQESSIVPPSSASSHTLNRREGGESLQVAAIYQMASFLEGEFGKHFQRPAFRLLTSIYQNLDPELPQQFAEQVNVEKLREACAAENRTRGSISAARQAFRERLWAWRADVQQKNQRQGLITALDATLLHQHGRVLRQHTGDLPGLILHGADFNRPMLPKPVELSHLDLRGVQAVGADLSGAHLEGADLYGANLAGADLSWAHLEGADLSRARLAGADLREAQLAGADLRGARLEGADLREAQLAGTDLSWAHLEGVDLSEAHLAGADLSGANLAGADLYGANLAGADLRGANLAGAVLLNPIFDAHTQWTASVWRGAVVLQGDFGDKGYVIDAAATEGLYQRLAAQIPEFRSQIQAIPEGKNAFNARTGEWLSIEV